MAEDDHLNDTQLSVSPTDETPWGGYVTIKTLIGDSAAAGDPTEKIPFHVFIYITCTHMAITSIKTDVYCLLLFANKSASVWKPVLQRFSCSHGQTAAPTLKSLKDSIISGFSLWTSFPNSIFFYWYWYWVLGGLQIVLFKSNNLRLSEPGAGQRRLQAITSGSSRLHALFVLGYVLLLCERLWCVFSFSEWHLGELVYRVRTEHLCTCSTSSYFSLFPANCIVLKT